MMNFKTQLGRPLFLVALGLLILNDFVLKASWHNAFTGKLSDVAGLFAFAFFVSAFCKRKQSIIGVYILTAFCFAFWKSPWSVGLIYFINQGPLHLGRVVDYSDVWALGALPLSYAYRCSKPVRRTMCRQAWAYPVVLVSCFAFVATSSLPETVALNHYSGKTYRVAVPKDSVVKRLRLRRVKDSLYGTQLSFEEYNSTADITVVLQNTATTGTRISLDSIRSFTYRDHAVLSMFSTTKRDKKAMKALKTGVFEKHFEQEAIAPLQDD